jgi:hypothetical protein
MRLTILAFILTFLRIPVFGQTVDYIEILSQYSLFDTIEYSLPDFTYQSDKSIECQNLRHKYNLDSIAGIGDEFDKQIELLKWVNQSFRHNGKEPLPSKISADSLVILGQNNGLNCGGLAIILNSAYLSVGYKSRFITCLNNDSTFNDPHTLTIVFSNHYRKWIMVDPTYCAYFIDEQGIPLSIEEIRYRLANGQKVILNNEFNLNSVSTSANKTNDYCSYITRNMFRFISPIHNRLDYDLDCLEYVHLIPQYFKLEGLHLGSMNVEGCSKVYCINNPRQFWK